MKSAVIVFPGSNRDRDTADALELVVGGIDQLRHQARDRGAREPTGPDQVGPAHRPLAGQQADDGALVGGAQPLECAGAGHGPPSEVIRPESGGTVHLERRIRH